MTRSIDENARKKLLAQIPTGALGNAEQVARLALYLVSDDASYITGQVFTMDGGLSWERESQVSPRELLPGGV